MVNEGKSIPVLALLVDVADVQSDGTLRWPGDEGR